MRQSNFLYRCQKKKFRDGWGWTLACPFCGEAQKRESKSTEICASLYPAEGAYTYFFSCNHTMRFATCLKYWNPPWCLKYVREMAIAKRSYQPKFPE